jgi:hypothetical protein
MLRRLMAWCVPDQALQLRVDACDRAGESGSDQALSFALASHGLESREPTLRIVPDTTARDDIA